MENKKKEIKRGASNVNIGSLAKSLEELKNGIVFLKRDLIQKKHDFEVTQ